MSIEKVRAYFAAQGIEDRIQEFPVSSATVELAAQALGVEGKRIAKTLSFLVGDQCVLIVAAGDAKVDNPNTRPSSIPRPKCCPMIWSRNMWATPWAASVPSP